MCDYRPKLCWALANQIAHMSASSLLTVCAGYMSNSRSLAASFPSVFFSPSSLLSYFLILLFCFTFYYLFWLFWVFIVVHGLLLALSGMSCGMWDFSSLTSDRTQIPCMGARSPIHCTTRDVPHITFLVFSSVVQSQSCLTLQPHGLQHTRLPCLSPTPGACSRSMSIESMMPSTHLILCLPLLLLPSIFPSIRVFSNEYPSSYPFSSVQ